MRARARFLAEKSRKAPANDDAPRNGERALIITCGTGNYPSAWKRGREDPASGERPTRGTRFSPHSGHRRLDRPTWKYSARASERTERASARLRYQENRCSTWASAIRLAYDRRRLTRRPTVRENIYLSHCTSQSSLRMRPPYSSITIGFIQFTDASSSNDRCYPTVQRDTACN